MKKLLKIFVIMFMGSCFSFVGAQDISIIPEGDNVGNIVREIATGGKVWANYRDKVEHGNLTLGQQFASGIMSWDTILDYCVYLAKFLGEVALLVGALALIYLGYEKIWKAIKPESSTPFSKVIIGLLVIIFAYAIIKMIWSAFIS